jgi:glycosyltransferase involved in cell wall biosynthesis
VLKRASIVRALSPRLKDRLITEFGINEDHIKIVSIYVDVTKLGLSLRTLSKEDSHNFELENHAFDERYGQYFNFLTVCRLVPIKRIELQLQALKTLLPLFPNLLLHIVGDGPQEVNLKELVVSLKLEKYVIFHGYQSGHHLGLFYQVCDCFLLTSDYEGWGMVIIEAATAGLPIIMTDVGCAGELIINEVSGLVVRPSDMVAITEAMNRIVSDNALRQKLSVGALHALHSLPTFPELLLEYKQNWELALSKPL